MAGFGVETVCVPQNPSKHPQNRVWSHGPAARLTAAGLNAQHDAAMAMTRRPGFWNGPRANWLRLVLTLVSVAFFASNACAHKFGDSYLTLKVDGGVISGRWDIALRDLENAVGLDANQDGAITWGELEARQEAVTAYAFSRLKVQGDGVVARLRFTDLLVDYHSDGAYAVLRFAVDGLTRPEVLELDYRLLFDRDPQHRGLFQITSGGRTQTAVFSPATPTQRFELASPPPARQFLAFAKEGVRHIWTGYDHILFLIALLLPSVLRRQDGRWQAVGAFRPAFINVFKIVTAFTVAHSVTLSLATLGIVQLPSRLIESSIAASVVLAAFNNLVPFFQGRGWLVAFGFGLIHGFGFANVLLDLELANGLLALALVGFNLGVEAGQLAIVSVFLPLAYGLRHSWLYQRLTLSAGSTAIMLVAATWMCERVFDFKWLPF